MDDMCCYVCYQFIGTFIPIKSEHQMWKKTQLITLSRTSPLVIRWNIIIFVYLKEYIINDVQKLYFANLLANQEVSSKSKIYYVRSFLDVNASETFWKRTLREVWIKLVCLCLSIMCMGRGQNVRETKMAFLRPANKRANLWCFNPLDVR